MFVVSFRRIYHILIFPVFNNLALPEWLSGEHVRLITWWLWVWYPVEPNFLSGIFLPPTSAEACEKSSWWLRKESCVTTGVRKPGNVCVTDLHMTIAVNPLPHMPILGSSNSAANKDMMSRILTIGDTIFWLSRIYCWNGRNCSLRAISSFPTMFSKAVCGWCVKMSIYGVNG